MQMEGAGVYRLADPHLFDPGCGPGRIKTDGNPAGMMLSDEGAAYALPFL
jgi:hypothetical protein